MRSGAPLASRAALALLFVPIVFGPAGIILGFVGAAKGDKPFGTIVGVVSIVTMIIGMVVGAIVFSSMS